MISKITNMLINNINNSPVVKCEQTTDNSGIFQFIGDDNRYKITVTKIKN